MKPNKSNPTGDLPVVLTVDGPSLGGFVCPTTITSSELWKLGQARPHDSVQFRQTTLEEAYAARVRTDALMAALRAAALGAKDALPLGSIAAANAALAVSVPEMPPTRCLLKKVPASGSFPGAEYRLAGDRYIQVRFYFSKMSVTFREAERRACATRLAVSAVAYMLFAVLFTA